MTKKDMAIFCGIREPSDEIPFDRLHVHAFFRCYRIIMSRAKEKIVKISSSARDPRIFSISVVKVTSIIPQPYQYFVFWYICMLYYRGREVMRCEESSRAALGLGAGRSNDKAKQDEVNF